ncbi:MAG: NAD(P)-dependent glycerol-3-phosphate dehydrogenase [Clostridia bacterium]|nr:NAD(P)-dependent glycerol-3-phosphate dehydrogenase [Clostridia bacterium]
MKKIAVIGSGSWGVALALQLNRNGHNVRVWSYNQEEANLINQKHKCMFLPNVTIPNEIVCYTNFEDTMKDAEIVLIVTPSSAIRSTLISLKPFSSENQIFVLCSKGMEPDTLMIFTDVIKEILPHVHVSALSGPSHAEEVSVFTPTAVVVSSDEEEVMNQLQEIFMSDCLRVYTNSDLTGVEVGGSLKNIIALACGISIGMGYGDNAIAALITRGLLEISRIGIGMGAKQETFYGLTGLGDLFVTCSSKHSRNRKCGILLGQGKSLEEAKKEVGMVVEGVNAVLGAYTIARKFELYTPIIDEMHAIITEGKDVKESVQSLMTRNRKSE